LVFSAFFVRDSRELNNSEAGRPLDIPPIHDRPWPIVPENMYWKGF
jgi:hypothetical protein